MQLRLNERPQTARERRQTVEHPFGTLKAWMGATHFLTRTLPKVRTEMSLHVLAYNMKRMVRMPRNRRPDHSDAGVERARSSSAKEPAVGAR
jgi:hypothetical protein